MLKQKATAETLYLQQASDDPTREATTAGIIKEHRGLALM
jgi:hypothetical protein